MQLPHVLVTFLILSATLAATRMTAERGAGELAESLDTIPRQIGARIATDDPPLEASVLRELKATSYLARTYGRPSERPIHLFVAYYARQRAGESMHSPKHCLPGAGWEIWSYQTVPIQVDAREVRINEYSIIHETDRSMVLYWYQTKERIFASEYIGKLLLARDALLRNSTAAAIVRIIVQDDAAAINEARAFAAEVIPQMQRCVGRK